MITNLIGLLLLLAFLAVVAVMMIAGIDTALRKRYERHALRYAREKYRRWCATTPVEVDKRLTFICGKGYREDDAG